MTSQLRVDSILPVDGAPTNGGGGIIQVVHGTATSETSQSFSTTNFADTGLSATITPKFSTSKILVTGYLSYYVDINADASIEWNFAVCDGSDNILDGTTATTRGYRANTVYQVGGKHPINFLHSPSTTSAFTYKMRMNAVSTNGSGGVYCQVNGTANNISRLTLMEVSA